VKSRIETSNCELRQHFALSRRKFVKKKLKTLCDMDFYNYILDSPLWLTVPLVIINLVLWGLLIYLIWKNWFRRKDED
jgi:hypothetical protein